MIRVAVPDDIPYIVELGIEALTLHPYEKLRISRERCFNMARECVSSSRNFAYVSEVDGEVKGAVLVLVHELMFHERHQASVIMFYCKQPGDGIKILREFLRWAKTRRMIKLIMFTLERDADPRIGSLLKRLGLSNEHPVYIQQV